MQTLDRRASGSGTNGPEPILCSTAILWAGIPTVPMIPESGTNCLLSMQLLLRYSTQIDCGDLKRFENEELEKNLKPSSSKYGAPGNDLRGILQRLRAATTSLPPKSRRVAEYVSARPHDVVHLSVT